MSEQRVLVGTISDAARRYGVDGAGIWEAIVSGRTRTLSNGRRVRIVADRRDAQDRWIVEEIEVQSTTS